MPKSAPCAKSLTSEDTSQIKRQTEELQNTLHALSQQMYAQDQPGSNGQGPTAGPAARPDENGEVVEGEFREA